MVDFSSLQKYVAGYSIAKNLLEVAFSFSELGETMLDIPPIEYGLYLDTHTFLHNTFFQGYNLGSVKHVNLEFDVASVPIENTEECNEYVPEISCFLEMTDKEGNLIYSDAAMFQHYPMMDIDQYACFAKTAMQKTIEVSYMSLPLDSFTLGRFVHYAIMIGTGMPVEYAVSARRRDIQEEYFRLQ